MSSRPNSRNWNDVQTALATVAIVTTLGLWNLFATPKPKVEQSSEPVIPPTEPPVESTTAATAESAPTGMPQVKITFAQATPQATVSQPVQNNNQQVQVQANKPKKNRNTGGGTVTKTKTS